jgi:hypothetical protein
MEDLEIHTVHTHSTDGNHTLPAFLMEFAVPYVRTHTFQGETGRAVSEDWDGRQTSRAWLRQVEDSPGIDRYSGRERCIGCGYFFRSGGQDLNLKGWLMKQAIGCRFKSQARRHLP